VWKRYVVPLTGQKLVGPSGGTNVLLTVDWTGVNRLTSNGRPQFIKIEIFQHAVSRIIERGRVTRKEINEDYVGRASSGVILILSQVPIFEHLSGPSRLVLRKS
jgi:hypothetical protein